MGFEKGDDYKKTWKSSEDGKVNSNQPMRMEDNRDGSGMPSTYITRYITYLDSSCSPVHTVSLIPVECSPGGGL